MLQPILILDLFSWRRLFYSSLKDGKDFKYPNGTHKGGIRNTFQIRNKKHFQRSIPSKISQKTTSRKEL